MADAAGGHGRRTSLSFGWVGVLAMPAAVGTALVLWLAFLGPESTLLACLKDDGYYYLTIARNIAGGHGVTFDGLGPTNGFHPLWAALLTPLYLFDAASPYTPIRAMIVLSLAVHLAAAFAVGAVANHLAGRAAGRAAGLLYAGNPVALWLAVSGMESPLVALCVALLAGELVRWQRVNGLAGSAGGGTADGAPDRRAVLRLGLVAGLCALARTELVLLSAMALAQIAIWGAGRTFTARLRQIALAGGVALLVMSPWLAWNLARFGSLVQVSPRAHHLVASSLREASGQGAAPGPLALGARLLGIQRQSLDGRLPGPALVVDAIALVVFLVAAWWVWSLVGTRAARRESWPRVRAQAALLAYAGGFVAAAFLVLGHMRSWYAAGPLVVVAMFMALPLRWALPGGAAAAGDGFPRRLRLPSAVIATGYAAGMLALFPVLLGEIHYESTQRNCWAEAAEVVAAATPPGARVAAFNCGTFGYLTPRQVVNLDCVVNNRALPWLERPELPEFVAANGIGWIVDDPQYVERYFRLFSRRDAAAYLAVVDTLPSGLVFYRVR